MYEIIKSRRFTIMEKWSILLSNPLISKGTYTNSIVKRIVR